MSSVEDSERDGDSLSEQLMGVLKINKLHKNRHHHKGGRSNHKEDELYRQALKQFMFGRFQQATQSCKKIIVSHPQNPQPYYMMGNMYQQAGKKNNDYAQLCKAAQYLFFHAYYSQPNIQNWLKVGDMSFELKLYPQAAYCYGRALKINGSNLQTNLRRCQSLQLCRETKKAINIYKKILQKISTSVQVYKRYAKLQFRKGQFSKSRQILLSYENYKEDMNIKFMICQTFLKQKLYQKLFSFLQSNVLQGQQTNIYDLQLQLVQMLFICSICTQTPLDSQALQKQLFCQYQQNQYHELYEQIIFHIQHFNQQMTFQFLSFLLKYKKHQNIENYLFISEFLKKKNKIKEGLKILKEGVKLHPNSTELSTQLNHLKVINTTKPIIMNKIKQQQIYYSDDQMQNQNRHFSQKQESQIQLTKHKKLKLIRKNKQQTKIQIKNPQISKRLLLNVNQSLQSIYFSIKKTTDYNFIKNHQEQIKNSLIFISQLDNQRHQQDINSDKGIFFVNNIKKRRINLKSNSRRFNFIYQNSQYIIRILRCIIYFMKQMMKIGRYESVLQFTQILSKANFFKCKNKIPQYKNLKTQIFQIGILACLFINKFKKCLFFLRFLIHRYPQNPLYLLLIRNITILKSKKMGLSAIIKKDFQFVSHVQGDQSKICYLMGLQYMDNCFFQLAITMFLNVIKKNTFQQQILRGIHLCLSACFIQIGSSRTIFNKLDYTNRSAYCLKKYQEYIEQGIQSLYNLGRWFCQVKMYGRAIQYLKKVLEFEDFSSLKKQAAYCLMIIYKQMQKFQQVNMLSQQYFSLQ